MGPSGGQAALHDLQLAAGDSAGTDTHARDDPGRSRVSLVGPSKVLRQAGIDPFVVVSGVDEDAVIASWVPRPRPTGWCARWPRRKPTMSLPGCPRKWQRIALSLAVIRCCTWTAGLCGKPASVEAARRQWQSMAGPAGQPVHRDTAWYCCATSRSSGSGRISCHHSQFGIPSPEDLDAYLDSGEPTKVAGGFTLDGLGGWFVDGVEGDPSSVIGIGLPLMRKLFRRAGLSLSALWAANPVALTRTSAVRIRRRNGGRDGVARVTAAAATATACRSKSSCFLDSAIHAGCADLAICTSLCVMGFGEPFLTNRVLPRYYQQTSDQGAKSASLCPRQ